MKAEERVEQIGHEARGSEEEERRFRVKADSKERFLRRRKR